MFPLNHFFQTVLNSAEAFATCSDVKKKKQKNKKTKNKTVANLFWISHVKADKITLLALKKTKKIFLHYPMHVPFGNT